MLEPGLCRVGQGVKKVVYGGREASVKAGEWLLLPADVAIDVENEAGPGGYLAHVLTFPQLMLRDFFQTTASSLPVPKGPTDASSWHLPPDSRLDLAWDRLNQSLNEKDAPLLQLHALQEMWLVIGLAGRLSPLLSTAQDGLTAKVQQLLMSDPSATWSQEEVASRMHMSSPTLRRHLLSEGQSFRAILEEVRMTQALNHLQCSSRGIEDIANACGYLSASRFAMRFRKRYGIAPRELRRAL